MGEGTADALVEQDEQERHLIAFVRQAVSIAFAAAFDEAVGFHLAKIVAELSESVGRWLQAEAGEDSLMDLSGAPPGDLRSAVEQHFHQANHPGVVNFEARDPDCSDCNRKNGGGWGGGREKKKRRGMFVSACE